MKLKELLIQNKSSEYIGAPENETFVTVSQKGQGLSRRDTSGNRTPVPFTGTRIKEGQFVYAKIGAFQGSFGIVPKSLDNAVVSKDFPVFDVSDAIIPDFLLLSLLTPSVLNTIEKHSTGALLKRCKEEQFLNIEISVPSKDIQRKIVNMIQAVDTCIMETQHRLELLDELVKSRFIELFGDPISNPKGWKTDKTENHIDLLSGFPFDSSQYTENGINICGGLIIMPQRIEWKDCKHWGSVQGYEEYTLKENDIVIALDRPWISEGFKIAMVDAEHLPALLIQRTARIRAIGINQLYLMYCFLLGDFDKHCNVTGSLVPHISAKDIRSFAIMLPPLDLQKQFATFVEQTDKSKLAITETLKYLEELKASLMSQYFG